MVLLGVGTLRNYSLPYSYESGIISNGMPVWLYAENNQVVATTLLPPKTDELPAIREIRCYGSKTQRVPGKTFRIPPYLLRAAGLNEGDAVGTLRRGNDIVFRKARKGELFETKPKKHSRPAVDGEVRGGRIIRFTPATKDRLGLSRNCWLHIRVNMVDGCWLEIAKKQPDIQLPTLRSIGGYEKITRFLCSANAEFQMFYSDMINLPAEFLRQSGLAETHDTIQLPCWIDDNGWFILEGMPVRCGSCGREIRRYRNRHHTLSVCGACSQRRAG